ncbi:hypothetical protein SLS60_012102 [Paraconiothyrium brasiliense]|uniref:Uncharacterized protein n=1 Tax=Paraconiothyrium brasiliense TaxID=300254 RepID=A0ABR3QGK3_9PLEO
MGRWASSGKNMAGILSNHAHEILSYVRKHGNLAKLPDTVRQIVPQPEDKWLAMLDSAIWEISLAWIPEHLLVVGDGCSNYLDQNVVGCMLPIRTMLEVTIVAATTQGHIRVHEASVNKSTTGDSAPTITITKCVDWEITNVDLEDPDNLEQWLNVMSYLCFTSEQNVAFADPGEQLPPLTAAPKRKNDVDIIDPEQENTHVEALDAGGKTAIEPADKARPDSLPKTPRKVLAPMNK